jgi:hypothetical protein
MGLPGVLEIQQAFNRFIQNSIIETCSGIVVIGGSCVWPRVLRVVATVIMLIFISILML